MINTVHDSIVVDTHPDEVDLMIRLLRKGTSNVVESLNSFYNVEFNVPLDTDIKIGYNWLDMNEIEIERVVL